MGYIEQMFDVTKKIVIITGGGGAIAGGFSEALLQAGARVALWDIAPDALEAARKRLSEATGKGSSIQCVKVDAMDEASVAAAVAETEKGLGAPNVLINAAGGNRGKNPFVETDMKLFDFVMKLNLVAGLMVPTKIVAKYWIDRKIKGQGDPPKSIAVVSLLLKVVGMLEGAISYVRADQLTPDVKALRVDGKVHQDRDYPLRE